MQEKKSFLSQNKGYILLGCSASLLAGSVFFYLKALKHQNPALNDESEDSPTTFRSIEQDQRRPIRTTETNFTTNLFSETDKTLKSKESSDEEKLSQDEKSQQDNNYEQLLNSVCQKIQLKFLKQIQNCFDFETIYNIYIHSIFLAQESYNQLTVINRRNRRTFFNTDWELYKTQIYQYCEDIETLFQKCQTDILEKLNSNWQVFEDSIIILMEKGGLLNQILQLKASIREKIKQNVPSNKKFEIKVIKKISAYKCEILQQKQDLFQKIIIDLQKHTETNSYVPIFVNLLIQDFIHEKFEIEEEDEKKNMLEDYINDPEIQRSFQQLEVIFNKIMDI